MPVFSESHGVLRIVPLTEFSTERDLQRLIEANLEVTFGCRFIASEFSTGSVHNGRIDSLALSEDGNPVIIEYKKKETSGLINQALFYLDWIKDHKGDFEIKAREVLGDVEIDWSQIRVICIAPGYDNYALHAVKHMPEGIELWKYRNFVNGNFELEEIFGSQKKRTTRTEQVNLEATEENQQPPDYTVEMHRNVAMPEIQNIFDVVNEYIVALDDAISVVPRKLYIAYKLARNIACVEVRKNKVIVYLGRKAFVDMPSNFHDMTNIGHWGTGDIEVHISNEAELQTALNGILETYRLAGGN